MTNDVERVVMLPCPFCKGVSEIKSKCERVGYEDYMRYVDSFYVVCLCCGARTADFKKKSLADTTDYTVKDFRENPTLRAKVEDDYVIYCRQLERMAIDAWNNRAT